MVAFGLAIFPVRVSSKKSLWYIKIAPEFALGSSWLSAFVMPPIIIIYNMVSYFTGSNLTIMASIIWFICLTQFAFLVWYVISIRGAMAFHKYQDIVQREGYQALYKRV